MALKSILFLTTLFFGSYTMGQGISIEQKEVFDDVAYSIPSATNKNVIVKWTAPIKYQILGEVPAYVLKEIEDTFTRIKTFSKLEISKTDVSEEANLIIKTQDYKPTNPLSMAPHLKLKYAGGVTHKTNEKSEITSATMIIIPSSFQSKSDCRYYVARDILKVIGFVRKTTKASYSIFYSYENSTMKIDKFDGGIISLLYNPTIKAGMTKQEVDKLLD